MCAHYINLIIVCVYVYHTHLKNIQIFPILKIFQILSICKIFQILGYNEYMNEVPEQIKSECKCENCKCKNN